MGRSTSALANQTHAYSQRIHSPVGSVKPGIDERTRLSLSLRSTSSGLEQLSRFMTAAAAIVRTGVAVSASDQRGLRAIAFSIQSTLTG